MAQLVKLLPSQLLTLLFVLALLLLPFLALSSLMERPVIYSSSASAINSSIWLPNNFDVKELANKYPKPCCFCYTRCYYNRSGRQSRPGHCCRVLSLHVSQESSFGCTVCEGATELYIFGCYTRTIDGDIF